jgi:alpha-glucuronidase
MEKSEEPTPGVYWKPVPDSPIRMLDHWDNMDGTIERGYAGRSLFFEDGKFREDWQLLAQYADLLASIRINAVSLNNVNVRDKARWLITNKHGELDKVAKIAEIFAERGIATYLSVNFAAPKVIGGLDTSDPLDARVETFWRERVEEIYSKVEHFGGFVVKADAEGEPGPYQYGRTHADGANLFARLLAPHGGLVFWRAFVYNCEQDWRDRTTDRAKAAWENFKPLDGFFEPNVVLQVKNGPLDFQIKEPVSPLLLGLESTRTACEFQASQEYLGQQQHAVFLAPLWKEVLDSELCASALVCVANTGLDESWTGHKLAQANLYAFGRLAWDSSLTPQQIAREWVQLTFPDASDRAREAIERICAESRGAYRDYTTNLGLCFMCRPGFHYGVDPDGYEYDRWGTYHFADRDGIGVDRTVATGSGYTAQYPPALAALYEDVSTCPDDVVLYFHHLPYAHRLQSGKSIAQHVYDAHFSGAQKAEDFRRTWAEIAGELGSARVFDTLARFDEQLRSATEWRDVINTYFYRHSGIADEHGRVIYP